MDENWYSAEQEIRDRISQARAAARVGSLVQELATPPPRRDSLAAVLRRWAVWIMEAPFRGGAIKSATTRLEKGTTRSSRFRSGRGSGSLRPISQSPSIAPAAFRPRSRP